MARKFTWTRRNPNGYEAASPRAPKGTQAVDPEAPPKLQPFLGYDDPLADPRVEEVVVVEFGRTVSVRARR